MGSWAQPLHQLQQSSKTWGLFFLILAVTLVGLPYTRYVWFCCRRKIWLLGFLEFLLPRTMGTWSSLSIPFFFRMGGSVSQPPIRCILFHMCYATSWGWCDHHNSGHNSRSSSLFSWKCVCPMLLLEDCLHQDLRVVVWSMFFLSDDLSTMCPFQ